MNIFRTFCIWMLLWCHIGEAVQAKDHAIEDHSPDFFFDQDNSRAYEELLKLRLTEANFYLQKAKEASPDNGLNIYLENFNDVLHLLISEDLALYEKIAGREDERIRRLRQLDKQSPYYRFVQAEIRLQWALVKFKFDERLAGAMAMRKAYVMLMENQRQFPDFLPQRKSIGLFKVLLGSVPDNYRWALDVMGFDGDIPGGLEDLEVAATGQDMFALEARISQMYLKAFFLNRAQEALKEMQLLRQKHPDNLLIGVATASIARKAGAARVAFDLLQQLPQTKEYAQIQTLDYLRTDLCVQTGDYDQAILYGKRFLSQYKGKSHLKDTHFKLFLAYWFRGEDQTAMTHLRMITQTGSTVVEQDRHADKFARYPTLPNKSLTQARYYSDGGEFDQALRCMQRIRPEALQDPKDRVEYQYRYARIYHGLNRFQDAVAGYRKTMELGKALPHYFAANSALQLGYICRDHLQDPKIARYYFEQVLSYRTHEYKESLDQKAKTALALLKKD